MHIMDTKRFSHLLLYGADADNDFEQDDRKYLQLLNRFGLLLNDAFYIIDFGKWRFLHVVSHGLFLGNYEVDEVVDSGFSHYDRIVHKDDLKKMDLVNAMYFRMLYDLPQERRMNACLNYDFRIKDRQNNWVLANHQMVPLELTPAGEIRLGLCKVSLSTANLPGNAILTMNDTHKRYRFSDIRQSFILCDNPQLSEKAIQIIIMSSKGLSETEISDKLSIGLNTVKYHKKNIFKKLKVRNILGAIQWLSNNKVSKDEL